MWWVGFRVMTRLFRRGSQRFLHSNHLGAIWSRLEFEKCICFHLCRHATTTWLVGWLVTLAGSVLHLTTLHSFFQLESFFWKQVSLHSTFYFNLGPSFQFVSFPHFIFDPRIRRNFWGHDVKCLMVSTVRLPSVGESESDFWLREGLALVWACAHVCVSMCARVRVFAWVCSHSYTHDCVRD